MFDHIIKGFQKELEKRAAFMPQATSGAISKLFKATAKPGTMGSAMARKAARLPKPRQLPGSSRIKSGSDWMTNKPLANIGISGHNMGSMGVTPRPPQNVAVKWGK